MKLLPSDLPGVVLIEPTVHRDTRGFFLEAYQAQRYRENGIAATFVQDNHSASLHRALRGLHAQLAPKAQDKLIRVLAGEIYDVAVDARLGSPSFGKHFGTVLSSENHRQLFVPAGFLHGFLVTSERAEVEYKCSEIYAPECEIAVAWDDPGIGIAWPLSDPILSPRDSEAPRLADIHDRLPRFEDGT